MNAKAIFRAMALACSIAYLTGCVVRMQPAQQAQQAQPDAASTGGAADAADPAPVPPQVERPAPTQEELHKELDAIGHWEEVEGAGYCWIPGPEVAAAAVAANTGSNAAEPSTGDPSAAPPVAQPQGTNSPPDGTNPPPADPSADPANQPWRPYTNGEWVKNGEDLTWQSRDLGGDTTSHFGNWFYDAPHFRWVWVPGTVWAPAWVSWHEGDVYSGWAPLPPVGIAVVAPEAYVFVDRRFITSYRVYGFIRPARENITIVRNTHVIGRTEIIGGHATTHTMTRSIQANHPTKFRSAPHRSAPVKRTTRTPQRPTQHKPTPSHTPAHPQQKAMPQHTTPQHTTPQQKAMPQHSAPQHAPAKAANVHDRKKA
jgi:hypothetical protein